eukprot:Lithocolla_globosa_v1_NODE_8749_length_786_cov_8.160055.p1 type:complete len:229 gc:universal NODE_8749_length_786_cov_8.160055:51-737(+)
MSDEGSSSSSGLGAEQIIVALIAMPVGLWLAFFGYRFHKLTVMIAGCLIGYVLFLWMFNTVIDDELTLQLIAVGFGLCVGFLLLCLYKIRLFIIGFLAGFTLAAWMLAWWGSFASVAWDYVFIISFAIIMGLLTAYGPFKKVMIVGSTSWYGSYFFFYGVDQFADTGYAKALESILSGGSFDDLDTALYAMLGGSAAMFVCGLLVQFGLTGRGNHHESEDEYEPINNA